MGFYPIPRWGFHPQTPLTKKSFVIAGLTRNPPKKKKPATNFIVTGFFGAILFTID